MTRPRRPAAERILERVDTSDPGACWVWTGYVARGYGRVRSGGHDSPHVLTHRAVYEAVVGPIPDGLVIDHLCLNTVCVNPAHLEAVTNEENVRRAWASGLYDHLELPPPRLARTHCKYGHEMTPENTAGRIGEVRCRICRREREREKTAKRRAKRADDHPTASDERAA